VDIQRQISALDEKYTSLKAVRNFLRVILSRHKINLISNKVSHNLSKETDSLRFLLEEKEGTINSLRGVTAKCEREVQALMRQVVTLEELLASSTEKNKHLHEQLSGGISKDPTVAALQRV